MPTPIGAHVEIVEPWPVTEDSQFDVDTLPAIRPHLVRINGVDVGTIKKGSLVVSVSDDDATEITLTLLPRKVEIKAEAVAQPRAGNPVR